MKVKHILPGDIIKTPLMLKQRPCIVISVSEQVCSVVPLSTKNVKESNVKVGEHRGLLNNRFLKEPSYFSYSVVDVPVKDAKENMLGYVDKDTYEFIKREVTEHIRVKALQATYLDNHN